jgi:hypothetical protein
VKIRAAVLLFVLMAPFTAEAKVLYVDRATGNDSVSYANNGPSTPWASIGRAVWGSTNRGAPNSNEAARAGDTVIVRAGTYSVAASGQRYEPSYNPVNSGTASARIIIQAEGTVNLTHSSSSGPAIGVYNKNYISWIGFTVNQATAAAQGDTGPAVLWYTNGSSIENCNIDGNGDPRWNDNHVGIRIENSTNVTVRNNRINNVYTSGVNDSNGAGIQVYHSGGVLIENNEISNVGSGIFLKAPFGEQLNWFTIRYNLVRNATDAGIAVHRSPNPASAPTLIYQNVVLNTSGSAIRIWPFDPTGDPSTEPMNVKVVNNTIVTAGEGLYVSNNLAANAGHVFWNNIVVGGSNWAVNFAGQASTFQKSRIDFEHNLYSGFSTFSIVYTSNQSFSSWKSTYGQDNASPASVNTSPMFVDSGNQNYRLQAGSPARTLGVDRLDLNGNGSTTDIIPAGAYITGNEVIGLTGAVGGPPPTTPPAPAAPTNVRIIR